MAWYDDPLTVIAVAVVIIFACGVVIYAMRRLGTKSPPKKKPQQTQGIAGDSNLRLFRFTLQNLQKRPSINRFHREK